MDFIMYDLKEGSKRIKGIRKDAGMTQQQFATALNVSMETISKLERGQRSVSIDILCELVSVFGVTSDYILFGKTSDDFKKAKMQQMMQQFKGILETYI